MTTDGWLGFLRIDFAVEGAELFALELVGIGILDFFEGVSTLASEVPPIRTGNFDIFCAAARRLLFTTLTLSVEGLGDAASAMGEMTSDGDGFETTKVSER